MQGKSVIDLANALKLQDAVFDDMAEDVISACRKSLLAAARSLSRSSPATAQLFLIRHLLILKEMTASVDLIARRRNDDSGGVIRKCNAKQDESGIDDYISDLFRDLEFFALWSFELCRSRKSTWLEQQWQGDQTR